MTAAVAAPAPVSTPAAGSCPLKTADDWQAFITKFADDQRWVQTCEDSECDGDFVDFVVDNIQKPLTDCAGVIAQDARIRQCTDHWRRFLPAWVSQHDDVSYGFIPDNATYLHAEEDATKPAGMMVVPPELIAALPKRSQLEATARANGWKYLTHDSALGGVRTFVYIPDAQGRFDRWMLFNLSDDPDGFSLGTPLSMITVQKQDLNGNPLPAVRLNFRDYSIQKTGDSFSLSLPEDGNGKCYGCHPSGMRRLIERQTTVTAAAPVKGEPNYDPSPTAVAPKDFGMTRLAELNKIINAYGLPDWTGVIAPADQGPALGAQQGCTACHDGRNRGLLTVMTSTAQLQQKLVSQLSMPPQGSRALFTLLEKSELAPATMSDAERQQLAAAQASHTALLSDFYAQRLPSLKAWLEQDSCR